MNNEMNEAVRFPLLEDLRLYLGGMDEKYSEVSLGSVYYMVVKDLKAGHLTLDQLRELHLRTKKCMTDRDTWMNNGELSDLERDLGSFLEGVDYAKMKIENALK